MNAPPIHVIILNYNGGALNNTCIDSVLRQEDVAVTVLFIDNASTDGSLEAVRSRYGDALHYLPNRENLLFAAGCNCGLAKALAQGARYVLLLNNDASLEPHCLATLADFLENTPRSAGVQPLLIRSSAKDRVASAGCRVSRTGRAWDQGDGESVADFGTEPFEVAGITGGAALWRCAALSEIGLFDESFGMYYEDVDLSLRARKAGYALHTAPGARALHAVRGTTARVAPLLRLERCETNAVRLVLKHWTDRHRGPDALLWAATSLGFCLGNLLHGRARTALALARGFLYGLPLLARCLTTRRISADMSANDALERFLDRATLVPPRPKP